MKKLNLIFRFMILFVLVTAFPAIAGEFQQDSTILSGWVKERGKTFYYEEGKKVHGWNKISGKYYYFTNQGLQRNKIVGSRKTGRYYVDAEGVRIIDKQISLAVDFVEKYSNVTQSSTARLKECYRKLCTYPYVRIYGDHPSSDKISSYANYMLTKKGGNCYRYASAYAYIAKVLGFDVRVCVGGVTSRSSWGLSPHGWCELLINDGWKIVDCSIGRAHRNRNFFLISRGSYPFRLRCNHTFTMKIRNHKICWIQKKDGWSNR